MLVALIIVSSLLALHIVFDLWVAHKASHVPDMVRGLRETIVVQEEEAALLRRDAALCKEETALLAANLMLYAARDVAHDKEHFLQDAKKITNNVLKAN